MNSVLVVDERGTIVVLSLVSIWSLNLRVMHSPRNASSNCRARINGALPHIVHNETAGGT